MHNAQCKQSDLKGNRRMNRERHIENLKYVFDWEISYHRLESNVYGTLSEND